MDIDAEEEHQENTALATSAQTGSVLIAPVTIHGPTRSQSPEIGLGTARPSSPRNVLDDTMPAVLEQMEVDVEGQGEVGRTASHIVSTSILVLSFYSLLFTSGSRVMKLNCMGNWNGSWRAWRTSNSLCWNTRESRMHDLLRWTSVYVTYKPQGRQMGKWKQNAGAICRARILSGSPGRILRPITSE